MTKPTQLIISTILGIIGTFTRQYLPLLGFMIAAITLDVITGLIKAKKTGVGWNSRKGTEGFIKKIVYFVTFAFGIFLDCFIPFMLQYISITIPFNLPFTLIITCYIVLNEAISICENIYEINPSALPGWIINILSVSIKKIEELNGQADIKRTEKKEQEDKSEDKHQQ